MIYSTGTSGGRALCHPRLPVHGYRLWTFWISKDAYLIRAKVPGMKKEEFSLEIHDGSLTVSASGNPTA